MLARCQAAWTESVTKGVTNYHTLLDQIETLPRVPGEPVCLVTFNYDTLLEQAITDTLNFRFNKITDYVAYEYKVIKLHGSINWAHPIRDFKAQRSFSQDLITDIIDRALFLDVDTKSYHTVEDIRFKGLLRDPCSQHSQSPSKINRFTNVQKSSGRFSKVACLK